jgi:hypothetical protein
LNGSDSSSVIAVIFPTVGRTGRETRDFFEQEAIMRISLVRVTSALAVSAFLSATGLMAGMAPAAGAGLGAAVGGALGGAAASAGVGGSLGAGAGAAGAAGAASAGIGAPGVGGASLSAGVAIASAAGSPGATGASGGDPAGAGLSGDVAADGPTESTPLEIDQNFYLKALHR